MFDCPQCGEPTEIFCEGVCEPCCDQNQQALDIHNAQYDRWQKMTPTERDREIKQAMR